MTGTMPWFGTPPDKAAPGGHIFLKVQGAGAGTRRALPPLSGAPDRDRSGQTEPGRDTGGTFPDTSVHGQDIPGQIRTLQDTSDKGRVLSTSVQILGGLASRGGNCSREGQFSPDGRAVSLRCRSLALIVALQHEPGRSGQGHGARAPSTGIAMTVPEQEKTLDALREEFWPA
ncbi:MAG: hypothetical protein CVT79_02855 [Alphaproteobacteria bacterium HGW-Alphaproteobacteria-18]|nr:MAG: hypothetical protein CVT79_02855 [Alphaproteobacteria bacterium HGW-Alphaproteobacteria-18]